MKIIARSFFLLMALTAATAFAGMPAMNVTVSNAGTASYKGKTDANGTFATSKLTPGNYTVQLNSNSSELKGKKYTVVVGAGKKKVSADVAGEKFAGGGVALKVDVGAGLNITGQIAASDTRLSKGGKKMVWIPPQTGSNMPGRWVEEGSPEHVQAKNRGILSKDNVQKIQERSYNPQG